MWNFLLDYVTISVNGLSLDTLISDLNAMNVRLIDISRKSRTQLKITLPKNEYKNFAKIADRLSVSYSVVGRQGAGYSIMRAFGRPIIVIGSMLILLGVVFANYFVISIRYDIDADEMTRNELIEYCGEIGIYQGAYKKNWDIDEMELKIYLDVDNISFVSIKDRGSTIEIEAVERTQLEVDRNRGDMANVYAIKSCLIDKITLYNGECLVKVGDVVEKGQLLVSGNVPINNDTGIMAMGADADITGRVWYTASAEKTLYDILKVRNGQQKRNIEIKFGDISLFSTKRQLGDYESEIKEYIIFEGIIPIKYVVEYQFGVDTKKVDINLESAKYIAQAQAMEIAEKKVDEDATIINTSVNTIVEDNKVIAQVTIETNELISKRVIQKDKE